jgi:beta-lactam-binding protein with PASTA domain
MKKAWKTRQFWRTIAVLAGISLFIVVLTITSLRVFTRQGQSFIVPDLTGLSMGHLTSLEKEYGFKFIIIDSVFDQTHPPGTVLRHDPLPNSTVKRGRKFYVTLVSATPDMVTMPNLIDLSLRQATSRLEATGLFVGTVKYDPGKFQNAVLDQTYHGKHIYPGEKIRRGSYINLVVSGSKDGDSYENYSSEY